MQTWVGILALLIGVAFPMGMLFWLNARMRRKPTLSAHQVGLILMLNGTLPISLIALGLALLTGRLWTSTPIKLVVAASFLAALVASVGLRLSRGAGQRSGGRHDTG